MKNFKFKQKQKIKLIRISKTNKNKYCFFANIYKIFWKFIFKKFKNKNFKNKFFVFDLFWKIKFGKFVFEIFGYFLNFFEFVRILILLNNCHIWYQPLIVLANIILHIIFILVYLRIGVKSCSATKILECFSNYLASVIDGVIISCV